MSVTKESVQAFGNCLRWILKLMRPLSSPSCSVYLCLLLSQLEQAKELVRSAIYAGIMGDLGSGSNIDICVITREGVDYVRPYQASEYKDNR